MQKWYTYHILEFPIRVDLDVHCLNWNATKISMPRATNPMFIGTPCINHIVLHSKY